MKKNKIEYLALHEIKPYFRNPRRNDAAIAKVAESIQMFGFQNPIIADKEKIIIAGHTRFKAALTLGLETVPVIITDMDAEKAKAYRIADNKLAELAEWDEESLIEEMKNIDAEFAGLFDNLMSFEDEIQEAPEDFSSPEIEFSEELLLEHNYVVLYFDNQYDWNVAVDRLGLKNVKSCIKTTKSQKVGIARVLKGIDVINRIKNDG